MTTLSVLIWKRGKFDKSLFCTLLNDVIMPLGIMQGYYQVCRLRFTLKQRDTWFILFLTHLLL